MSAWPIVRTMTAGSLPRNQRKAFVCQGEKLSTAMGASGRSGGRRAPTGDAWRDEDCACEFAVIVARTTEKRKSTRLRFDHFVDARGGIRLAQRGDLRKFEAGRKLQIRRISAKGKNLGSPNLWDAAVPARMRATTAPHEAAGAAIYDGSRTVAPAGRDLGLSWPIVQHCFTTTSPPVLTCPIWSPSPKP